MAPSDLYRKCETCGKYGCVPGSRHPKCPWERPRPDRARRRRQEVMHCPDCQKNIPTYHDEPDPGYCCYCGADWSQYDGTGDEDRDETAKWLCRFPESYLRAGDL